jgi:hypothetical protein
MERKEPSKGNENEKKGGERQCYDTSNFKPMFCLLALKWRRGKNLLGKKN